MGSLSISHWLIVLAVVMVLFGTGKMSSLMGDIAIGMKAFKKNMAEEIPAKAASPRQAMSIAASQEPAGQVSSRDTSASHIN